MTTRQAVPILRHLRGMVLAETTRRLTDRELLHRFAEVRDETAFTALVQRHGRLVLSVCRNVLGHEQDAEDAFQATFLVLARKASTIHKHDSVASWLYRVAQRTPMKAKTIAARRRANEKQTTERTPEQPASTASLRELQVILDEEVRRLPEKYRAPFVLCCLEGKSHEDAARELGWKVGTMSSRVVHAREQLRQRLARRAVALSAASCAGALSEGASAAAVPAVLALETVQGAVSFVTGGAAGAVPTQVSTLANGVLKTMTLTNFKAGLVTLFVLSTLGLGAGLCALQPSTETKEHAPQKLAKSASERLASEEKPAARLDAHGDPMPDGAIQRIGTLRFRQGGGTINSLLLSGDGKTLVSKSYYGERSVCVWEFPTGKLRHQFPGHHNENRAVALSPDGKNLVIGMDTVIHFYDLTSGREVRQFKSTIGGTDGLAFAPDGKTLASGHSGDAVLLWDVASGKELARLPAQHNRSGLLEFSPDGKTLATGDTLDKTIRLFDVATRKERQKLTRPSYVHDLAFSPDGSTLAAGGDDGTIPLWDVASGKLLREMHGPFKFAYAITWSPDGKTLATSDYDERNEAVYLRFWDPATGTEQRHLRTGGVLVRSFAFTADGKTLIAGDGCIIRLWDVASGEERPPAAGNNLEVWALALSPDGKSLAYCGKDVTIWDLGKQSEAGTLPGHHWSIAFSPDGKTLAGGRKVNAIHLYDVAGLSRTHTLATDMEKLGAKWVLFRRVAFAPDGKVLASCGDSYREGARRGDHFVYLWDPSTGKELRRLDFKDDPNDRGTIENVAWSPDGRTLIASGRALPKAALVRLWDAATGKVLTELTAAINSWFPTWKDLDRSQMLNVEPRVVFSPQGWLLAINSLEKSIPVWEAATGRERCRLEGHDGPTCCVAFAPDGLTLASAGYDNTIRLWDVETGKELRKLTGHRGIANALAFTPDGKTLISGSDDTTILFWDVAGVTRRKRPVTSLEPQEWESLWKELTRADAVQAHQAMAKLTAAPSTVGALRERLHPALKLDADRLEQLIRDLDNDEFAVRVKAARAIERLGESARAGIEQALARAQASTELRRRLERLQQQLMLPTGEPLRELRALEMLERLRTAEARRFLRDLAQGAPEARLTREAKASLERLSKSNSP